MSHGQEKVIKAIQFIVVCVYFISCIHYWARLDGYFMLINTNIC